MAAATSSGSPMRPRAVDADTASSCSFHSASASLVLTTPGATALTRIFGDNSKSQLLGEVDQRSLRRVVRSDTCLECHTADRGGVDHGSTVLTHPGSRCQAGPQDWSPHVDVEGLGEARVILVDDRPERRVGARVVHQDVETAETLDRLLDALAGGILVRRVRRRRWRCRSPARQPHLRIPVSAKSVRRFRPPPQSPARSLARCPAMRR